MKQKFIVAILMLCLIIFMGMPFASAAGTLYFTAVNETILPLSDATMPTVLNGEMYVPYSVFTTKELGVNFYSTSGGNTVSLYKGSTLLIFNLSEGYSYDQNDVQYTAVAQKYNGIVYVPVTFVSSFFGYTYSYIDSAPAPIVRIKTSSVIYNDKTFVSVSRTKMESYLDEYYGVTITPSPSPSTGYETYENVTIFLSFDNISSENTDDILSTLDQYGYHGCFFVTKEELVEHDDLIRKIAGHGHSIGIRLQSGTIEEYSETSAVLFEVTKLRTLLVSADSAVLETAEQMAEDEGLLFWNDTKSFGSVRFSPSSLTNKLSTATGSFENLSFSCTNYTLNSLLSVLSYLNTHGYTIKLINEIQSPTPQID